MFEVEISSQNLFFAQGFAAIFFLYGYNYRVNQFARKLITEWRRLSLPFECETFILAVSGGADSTAMAGAFAELVSLSKLKNRYIVAHFNHGLRGEESDADEDFVRNLAAECGFEFLSSRISRAELKLIDTNLEQSCRIARYRFLSECAQAENAKGILVAHTRNDQAESMLLNLVRGAGLEGLAGMRTIRSLAAGDDVQLIRPLLEWADRNSTEDFARKFGGFREDEMNFDRNFKRVLIRTNIIPQLRDLNPKIIEQLSSTASNLQDAANALQFFSAELLSNTSAPLKIEVVLSAPKQVRTILIRRWLKQERGSLKRIGSKHISAILSLSESTKSGRVVEIPGFGMVRKKKGMLHFEVKG
ncbi:MAG: tRNA lysidine(34) synthetase TilS [Pyrinomonadaceae bacterium]